MSVTIREVKNKRDLRKFIVFPTTLFKKDKNYVPFMITDEMSTFSPESNPAFEFCECRKFLAYRDGKIVGRIAGIINHAANKKWKRNYIRYTRFDFIDDYEVSKALLDTVVNWGKEGGYDTIIGPIGFTDMDHEGMLVSGFDEFNMSITFFNHPYYLDHMEKLGLKKNVDWMEFKITAPTEMDPRLVKIKDYLIEKYGYKIVEYKDRKTLKNDAYEAFKVIDEAFSVLYGTVPLTDNVINKAVGDYIPLVNLNYICTIKDKENNIVGFAVLVPSIAKALKKSNGRLFPFGIFRVLKAFRGKNDSLEMFFIAIKPEHQKQGLPALIMYQILKMCIENGVKYLETGPELETNDSVMSMWKSYNARQHKRRRCYIKNI